MGDTVAPLYDEFLDLLATAPTPEQILAFAPSASLQGRVDALLNRNRTVGLTEQEAHELDEYERLEHLVRLLKARVIQKRSA
jgi:hypothetical protein